MPSKTRTEAARQSRRDAKARKAKARKAKGRDLAAKQYRSWLDRTKRKKPQHPVQGPALGMALSMAAIEHLIATPEERLRDQLENGRIKS